MNAYQHECGHIGQQVPDEHAHGGVYVFPCARCSREQAHVRLVILRTEQVEGLPNVMQQHGEQRVYVKEYGDAPEYAARWVRVVQTSEEL